MTSIALTCVGPAKQRALPDFVDRRPVATVAQFDDWLRDAGGMMARRWSGSTLRRIILMRRRCESFTEIARSLGKSGKCVKEAFDRLPKELR